MKSSILTRKLGAAFFACLLAVSAMPSFADNEEQGADVANYYLRRAHATIPQFSIVSPALLRGAAPGQAGLELLKQGGVKTIIDLRGEKQELNYSEEQSAKNLGLQYVRLPMRHLDPIPQSYIKRFTRIVEDPANHPVYVHCEQGKDRTGAMVALYRLKTSGWSPTQAYREMLSFDFHPLFRPLVQSVWSYSNQLGFNEPLPPMTDAVDDIKRRYRVIMNDQRNRTREPGANPADELVRRLQSVIKNL